MAERKRKKPTQKEVIHTVTPGSTIRFEQPHSKRGEQKERVTVVVAQELNPVGGFVNFLREHAVVGLAVGFAIATQAQELIKSLIKNFINPLYGVLLNTQNLDKQTSIFSFHGRQQELHWGAVIAALLNFIFVLAAIYAIIKIFKLDKLDKKDEKDAKKK
jgi:large-conductance mechanosensitive channel